MTTTINTGFGSKIISNSTGQLAPPWLVTYAGSILSSILLVCAAAKAACTSFKSMVFRGNWGLGLIGHNCKYGKQYQHRLPIIQLTNWPGSPLQEPQTARASQAVY